MRDTVITINIQHRVFTAARRSRPAHTDKLSTKWSQQSGYTSRMKQTAEVYANWAPLYFSGLKYSRN